MHVHCTQIVQSFHPKNNWRYNHEYISKIIKWYFSYEEYILWNVCINSSKWDILKFEATFIEAQGPCNNKIKFDPYGTVWNRHFFLIGLIRIQVFIYGFDGNTGVSSSSMCQDGWIGYNNMCYLFVTHMKASWNEAMVRMFRD